jgi:hypothetical protein
VYISQLLAAELRLAELMKKLNEEEGTISSLNRRIMLLEVSCRQIHALGGQLLTDTGSERLVANRNMLLEAFDNRYMLLEVIYYQIHARRG